jgi:N utilization substance protein B
MATRHLLRIIVVQSLYQWLFNNKEGDIRKIFEENLKEFGFDIMDPEYGYRLLDGILNHLDEVEERILKYAEPRWSKKDMPLINLCILILGIYELLFQDPKEVPPKVAISEALEITNFFSNQEAVEFINGVLASVYKEKYPE